MNDESPEVDLQPTLTGPRVLVRPLQAADWPALYGAASDPQIWAQHPARDRYLEPVFRAFFDSALARGSAFVFVDRNNGRIFGSSRYHGYDRDQGEIEIGWTFLERRYWGGSYNKEIKTLMLEHAFTFADCVLFWIAGHNVRSRRAVEKIGADLREGIHYREPAPDVPHVIYEIRRFRFLSAGQGLTISNH
jgi:RimJ/RimL family protein N-acetyltransferase